MRWSYRHTLLALCTLAFFVTMTARLAISPVVLNIVEAFDTSNATVGLALSGMWLAYALSQFPSGVLGDRFGERRIILAAIGLTGLGSASLALSPSLPAFVLFAVFLGAGAGLHFSVAATLLTKNFENTGTALGLHNVGAPLAGLLAPIGAASVGVRLGWRYAIALGVVVALPVFVTFAWRVRPTEPERPDQPMAERFELGPLVELLSRRPIAFTVGVSVLCAFVWQGTASFLPSFLVAHHGVSQTTAGGLFSAFFVVNGVTQPVVGRLADRLSRDRVLVFCVLVGVVGYTLLVLGSGSIALVVAIVLVGTAMSWPAATLPRFMDKLSDSERGAGFGLVRTIYMVLASAGSVGVGAGADLFGWGATFGLLAGLLAVVSIVVTVNAMLGYGA